MSDTREAATGPREDGASEAGARVAIVTLGCGRNEVDSDQLAGLLQGQYEVVDDATRADVVLVNTCTFIEPAKKESVDTILAAADLKDADRAHADGRDAPTRGVVVIGCMAQRYPQELSESLPEADAIVGFAGYPALPGLVGDILAGRDHDRIVGVEASTAPSVLPGRSLPVVSVTADGPAARDEPAETFDPPGADVPAGDTGEASTDPDASWMAPVPEAAGAADATSVIDPLAVARTGVAPTGLARTGQAPDKAADKHHNHDDSADMHS